MINYILHDFIDKGKWDECITKSRPDLIYAHSWYLDIVCSKWDALVENDYERVMPLTCNRKYFIHYLYQPFFTQQLGIFSPTDTRLSKAKEFMAHIPSKFRYADISLNEGNLFSPDVIPFSELHVQNRRTLVLNLDKSYEKLQEGYSQNTKRNIRRAVENQINIEESKDPDILIQLFCKNKGQELNSLKHRHYSLLKKLMETSFQKGTGKMLLACSPNGEPCGSAFFLSHAHRHIFLFSATNSKAKATGAMTLLIDSFIQREANQPVELDFEGSVIEGLARFYKSFGATERQYQRIQINRLPKPLRNLKKAI
ncbi:MAG: hypothetical protein Q8907_09910 [Bacteroidota bacterium]|nr:hypothetical protein [Bacteroidota bacterium]